MSSIDDTTILARAMDFCDQNATTWEKLSDYNRRRYLARAREQLLDEDAGDLISQGLFRDPCSGGVAVFSLGSTVANNTYPRMIEPMPMAGAAD